MSTKSILKNVNVKGQSQVRGLVNALENAEKFRDQKVVLSRTFSEIKGNDVKLFFEGNK